MTDVSKSTKLYNIQKRIKNVKLLQNKIREKGGNIIYILPAVQTILLLAACGVCIYFWLRNNYSFKTMFKREKRQKELEQVFGGPIENKTAPTNNVVVEPDLTQEPKPARDEKTGIVSV